uniref:G-protein coupled receptors family 1 profile domain-containing protein n=1 Tax=Panagrolaimus sp. PS1159 TaxID=55785 RepID=A0AC35GHK1_9BILA
MSNANASQKCLPETWLQFSADPLEKILTGYLVPFLILFGFTGNLLNLSILMAPGMKTRSNLLLACLAVADMVFLILMLPHSFANYDYFVHSYTFRLFYVRTKTHLIAFANWSSAAAIWLIFAICLERLVGIRHPLSVRYHRVYQTYLIAGTIIGLTFLLTFYSHISYFCHHRVFCNGTQPHALCMPVSEDIWSKPFNNTASTFHKVYVRWSLKINAIFGVFLPTVVVAISNAMLIFTLRQRQKFLSISIGHGTKTNGITANGNVTQSAAQLRLEQRVTLTVCAIVSCFIITQAPSAVVNLIGGFVQHSAPTWHKTMSILTTFMVTIGKSLNFVLFCLSSANFRHKLVTMSKQRLGGKKRFRRYSMDTELNTQLTTIQTPYSSRNSSDYRGQNGVAPANKARLSSLTSNHPRYMPLDTARKSLLEAEKTLL